MSVRDHYRTLQACRKPGALDLTIDLRSESGYPLCPKAPALWHLQCTWCGMSKSPDDPQPPQKLKVTAEGAVCATPIGWPPFAFA